MITSPTGKGVVLIGGSGCGSCNHANNHFLELSGDSEKTLKWSFMDQKLQSERWGHAVFTIPNQVFIRRININVFGSKYGKIPVFSWR